MKRSNQTQTITFEHGDVIYEADVYILWEEQSASSDYQGHTVSDYWQTPEDIEFNTDISCQAYDSKGRIVSEWVEQASTLPAELVNQFRNEALKCKSLPTP